MNSEVVASGLQAHRSTDNWQPACTTVAWFKR